MHHYFLLFIIIITLDPQSLSAESKRFLPGEQQESLLLPYDASSPLYKTTYQALSKKSRWKIRMYGLRNAPLDPLIWGIRALHRTRSRNLTPMRPYYLRASEAPSFLLKSIVLHLQFDKAKKKQIRSNPERMTPLIDIGFAGTISKDRHTLTAVDRNYLIRLSANSDYPSGLYMRNGIALTLIEEIPLTLETGKKSTVEINVASKAIDIQLNDSEPLTIQSPHNSQKGLVSLTTDWHPLSIESLIIKGSCKDIACTFSGLYPVEKQAS